MRGDKQGHTYEDPFVFEDPIFDRFLDFSYDLFFDQLSDRLDSLPNSQIWASSLTPDLLRNPLSLDDLSDPHLPHLRVLTPLWL